MTTTRQADAYEALTELTKKLCKPAVGIVVDLEAVESHVQIHVPGTDRLEDAREVAKRALYALSLYLMQIEGQINEAKLSSRVSS